MSTQLDQILAHTLLEVTARKAVADFGLLESMAAAHTPRGFRAGLQSAAKSGPAIIAEIKKASPSKGLIRSDFHPATLAKTFEASGAAALSILTDEEFFQGSLAYLQQASGVVKIPCLRKDFILDPFQILEARAYGADAILLIVTAHTDKALIDLRDEANSRGLDVLCETHNREEMERAIALGFDLIGVNSRDLRTFSVRTDVFFELAASTPKGVVTVAESGIRTAEDIASLRAAGYDAFLIGETLMRQPDPAAALATLLDREYSSDIQSISPSAADTTMWIKICANTNLEDAKLAAELGADALGFVFAPSPRRVTSAEVAKITPHLPANVERVGVFQSLDAYEIARAAHEAGLTAVQLHSGVDFALLQRLHKLFAGQVSLIQTIHWQVDGDGANAAIVAGQLRRITADGFVDRVLIDSKVGTALGGTGISFDWDAARTTLAEVAPELKLIVAGGLRPENVAEAIQRLNPWGVDVASGVESEPGRKSPEKLAAFIRKARESKVDSI